MELWLLVGALVLIALTVWIVWSPQRPHDAEEKPVTDLNRSTIPPQGDKFEDQYTSATADLSAGGVATAREAASSTSSAVTPQVERAGAAASTAATNASEAWSSATNSSRDAANQPWSAGGTLNVDSTDGQRGMLPDRRTMGVGATAVVAVAGGVGGAWLYQRWQRRRNTRINRLRRGAFSFAGRLSERMPETDLPAATAPLGGAGAALIVSSLLVARALRREQPPTVEARVEQGRGILQSAVDYGKHEAFRRLQVVILQKALEEARRRGKDLPITQMSEETTKRGGIGLGGLLLIGGIGFVLVRMLRGGRGAHQAPVM